MQVIIAIIIILHKSEEYNKQSYHCISCVKYKCKSQNLGSIVSGFVYTVECKVMHEYILFALCCKSAAHRTKLSMDSSSMGMSENNTK